MIRNFNKTESTKKLLSDVKQLSWHSTRSVSNFSMASGQEGSGSIRASQRSISRKASVSKYDRVKLNVEECVRAEPGSPFAYETVVRRRGNKITMDMQLTGKTFPLFVAEKHGQTYVFRSHPKNHDCATDTIMGTLCKKPLAEGAKKETLTYALTHHDQGGVPQKIVYFDFDYATKLQLLTDPKKHPRRCRAYVFGRSPIETKEPYGKDGGERSLDFHGRGREGSRKNMQLQDKEGKVVCQMVKWGRDQFHVDYSYPFDAFHAFGFALAQFDM